MPVLAVCVREEDLLDMAPYLKENSRLGKHTFVTHLLPVADYQLL